MQGCASEPSGPIPAPRRRGAKAHPGCPPQPKSPSYTSGIPLLESVTLQSIHFTTSYAVLTGSPPLLWQRLFGERRSGLVPSIQAN